MIHNLPDRFIGLSPPFPLLPRGAAFELRSGDGIVVRRGIVMRDPCATPDFVWYHSKTRYVTGEEPVCHGFDFDIDASCFSQLKMYAVDQFDSFFNVLPYALKKLLGHTKRTATKRGTTLGPQPLEVGQIVQSVSIVDDANHQEGILAGGNTVALATVVVDDVSQSSTAQAHLHHESQTAPSVMRSPTHHGNQTIMSPVVETIHRPVIDAPPVSDTAVPDHRRGTTTSNPVTLHSRALTLPHMDPPTTVPAFATKPQRKPRSDRGIRRRPYHYE